MASFVYNSCLLDVFRAKIDFEGDRFKVLFLTDKYEPEKETHATRADLSDEAFGKGYTAGGIMVDVYVTLSTDKLILSLGGITLPNATVSARYAVYCVDRGGEPEEDSLIACIDFGGNVTSTNGNFDLKASSLRILN